MTKNEIFAEGMVKVKENDHHAAIALFTKVLTIDPKDANALSQRGVAYLNIEEYGLSLVDMDQAVTFDPDYAFRYQSRAYLKARIKDYEGAIADYEKAVELDPKDPIAVNNLALAQEQMGWNKEAKANFDKSDNLAGVKTATERAEERTEQARLEREVPAVALNETASKGEIAKAVFTKKNAFKDFLHFIKNGFKIKAND